MIEVQINSILIVITCLIAIHNFIFLHKHRDEKNRLINEDFELYPLVEPEFYEKTIARQTVENNQEIQEINLDIKEIKKKLGID